MPLEAIKENWIAVAPVAEFGVDTRRIVELDDGTRVLIANVEGEYFAVESMCSHAMFDLDDAPIEDCMITCPLHGAAFSLRTGAVLSPPAFEGLVTFPVRIVDGEVQVRDTRWD